MEEIEEETSKKSYQGDQEKYQLVLQEFQEEKSWKWDQPKDYLRKVLAHHTHIQAFASLQETVLDILSLVRQLQNTYKNPHRPKKKKKETPNQCAIIA